MLMLCEDTDFDDDWFLKIYIYAVNISNILSSSAAKTNHNRLTSDSTNHIKIIFTWLRYQ